KLATLDLQGPLGETFGIGGDKGWESLKIGAPKTEQLRAIFEENQLRRFLSELPASQHQEPDDAPALSGEHQPLSSEHYNCVTTRRQLAEMCLELAASGGFAFDTETSGLDCRSDHLVGMSFAADRQRCWYVPMRHQHLGVDAQAGAQMELGALTGWRRDPQQIDPDEVLSALRPLLTDPALPKAAQNAKFDLQMLQAAGVSVQGLDFDPMLASYLLDAHQRKHGLDTLAERWLGHEALGFADLKDLSGAKGTKKNPLHFGRVGLAEASAYACEDAQIVWALREQMEPQLNDSELRELMQDMELPLSHVLSDMEQTGIRVDVDKLQALSDELGQRADALVAQATELVGRPFNLGSPKQLQQILFEELGLKSRKRTKTGFSTDSSVLEVLADAHPLPKLILQWRQATKLKNTYTDVLPTLVHPKTKRIHTSFHQAVAATGRLSSSSPNLQNIPVRTEDGARIRDAFVAAPGHVLLAADYSQIELRVLAHLCGDPAMSQAFSEGADVHARTASLLFDTAESEVSREERAMAKTVNFGVLYGMSASRLAREQSISSAEAKAFIERYFNRFPRIEQWKIEAMDQARQLGASKTLLGRVRKLPELHSKSRMARAAAERIAINTPIQGSAADIIKRAMIVLHDQLATEMPEVKLLLQVHDELVLEVPEQMIEPATELATSVMENAFDLSVPLVVNTNHGQTWLEAH
ncbi:MAG TPA: DNA polymerase I, partial [Myxococcales bacterium]|nr:DNA polymerase I [Myxococcales bacterium]